VTALITKKRVLQLLLLIIIVAASITLLVEQKRPSAASTNVLPHIQGAQLIDSSGNPFLLRGAQIENPLAYMNPWKNIKNVQNDFTRKLNSTVFQQMSQKWHMNAVRLPLSNWVFANYQKQFFSLLDPAIQQANQAGLYVILDLHDYRQGGSPYGSGANAPKPESVTFWKAIAAHYLNNPMVMFDAYNEAHYTSANQWLKGGGTQTGSTGKTAQVIGMQALVNTIRATGAKQIIIIGGVHVAGTLRINDPNIMYTAHTYHKVAAGSPTLWDKEWGSFKGHYPLFYGEWALLPNSTVSRRCETATMQNANQKVTAFLNYMGQNQISWTAWQFDVPYLLQNRTTFTPTRLDDPNNHWTCNSPNAVAGMGAMIQQYLSSHSSSSNQGSTSSDQNTSPRQITRTFALPRH